MKKSASVILLIFILLIFVLFIVKWINKNDSNIENTNKKNIENNIIENNIVNNTNTIQTLSEEIKITPNTKFCLKTYYETCGHAINSYAEIPSEMVNMTEDEIKEKYTEWNIEKFSEDELILIKEEEGFCDEHYLLKEKDGFIAVYLIDRVGQEVLKEITSISIQYLPQNDLLNIKDGIKVYGKEALNKTLEDYE